MIPPSETSVIFVSDGSAEADRLSDLLRVRGYAVVDVPLSFLVARVAVQRPSVVLVDIDADSARATLARLRSLPGADEIELLLLTERDPDAALDSERAERATVLARPVETAAFLAKIEKLVGPSGKPRVSEAPPSEPPKPQSERPSELPARTHRDRPSPFPVHADFAWTPTPDLLDASGPSSLSPDLESLLRQAEGRVDIEPLSSQPPLPSPEEEVDAVLPDEVLAALDEPLSYEDDDDYSHADEESEGPRRTAGRTQTGNGSRPTRTLANSSAPKPLEPRSKPSLPEGSYLAPATPASLGEMRTDADAARPTVAPRLAHAHELTTPKPWATTPPPPLTGPSEPRTPPPAPIVPLSPAWSLPPAAIRPSGFPEAKPSPKVAPVAPDLPEVLGEGDLASALAKLIAGRTTGSLCVASPEGIRRILLREGDFVTAASGIEDESLLAFLVARGDLPKSTGKQLRGRLPAFGRRAGAALIAYGHLEQDQLWPVLRAHAEWVIACALVVTKGTCALEAEPPERLRTEPSVFGGATGAEIFVEIARRVFPSEQAIEKLGGLSARIAEGSRPELLSECALPEAEALALSRSLGGTVEELYAKAPSPELPTVLYVLTLLGALTSLPAARDAQAPPALPADPLDADALRTRVRARLDLVHEGDYFAVLGVSRSATAYEIRRAYLELRRTFEPSRVLTAATADLADDMKLIVEVLDEAYEILRDSTRRERYRRAIEAGPPA